jgi:hypothetical protein
MKRLFIVGILILAGIAALGIYKGWIRLSTDKTDQKFDLNVTVDKDKFRADEKQFEEQIGPARGKTQGQPRQP